MGFIAWVLKKIGLGHGHSQSAPIPDIPLWADTHPSPEPRVVLDPSQRAAIAAAISDDWDTEVILIHGGAGTGKSEVVRRIARKFRGRSIIVAPTGIAAHNVEGVTVHSQFGFPGCVLRYRADSVIGLLGEDEREALRRALLIIIDEISMVRADLLDAIDWSLRLNLECPHLAFGGKKIVMVGDLFQLEPVAPEKEKQILRLDWPVGHFFFDARVWHDARLRALELTTVHRQKQDGQFADCLLGLRAVDPSPIIDQLNALIRVTPEPRDRPILVTLNKDAENINSRRLNELSGSSKLYDREPEGDFPKDELRAPKHLVLKRGARVLVTANAPGGQPYLYVNGTLGVVQALLDHAVTIKKDDGQVVTIGRHLWEHKKYLPDEVTGRLRLKTVGTFRQIPMKLAWAMSVHKSQGLTFTHQHINTAQPFFASGQGYVALTRCRSASGLTVSSPIHSGMVWWDARLRNFLAEIKEDSLWPPPDGSDP